MRIYLARHGETLFNVKYLAQGACDSPLTEKGIDQARKLQQYFHDMPLAAAYSSDLNRAYDTACIAMAGKQIQVERCKEFNEMDLGTLEGDRYDRTFRDLYYDGFEKWNGENKEEVAERFVRKIKEIYLGHEKDAVAVFSHGWSIRSFLRLADQKRLDDLIDSGFHIPNCSLSIVDHDGTSFLIRELFIDVLAGSADPQT